MVVNSQTNGDIVQQQVIGIVCAVPIILLAVAGNGGVFCALLFGNRNRARSVCDTIGMNMCAAGLLLGLVMMPLAAALEFNITWALDNTVCFLWRMINSQCHVAFILLFLYMAMDRTMLTIDPTRYTRRWLYKHRLGIVFAIWVLSIGLSYGLTQLKPDDETGSGCPDNQMENSCSRQPIGEAALSAVWVDLLVRMFPMIAIMCLYWTIQILLMRRRRQVMVYPFTPTQNVQDNQLTSTANTLAITVSPSTNILTDPSTPAQNVQDNASTTVSTPSTPSPNAQVWTTKDTQAIQTVAILVGLCLVIEIPSFILRASTAWRGACLSPITHTLLFWLSHVGPVAFPVVLICLNDDVRQDIKGFAGKIFSCQLVQTTSDSDAVRRCTMTSLNEQSVPATNTRIRMSKYLSTTDDLPGTVDSYHQEPNRDNHAPAITMVHRGSVDLRRRLSGTFGTVTGRNYQSIGEDEHLAAVTVHQEPDIDDDDDVVPAANMLHRGSVDLMRRLSGVVERVRRWTVHTGPPGQFDYIEMEQDKPTKMSTVSY
jgi:hypothetical protein